jgi:hypothetical protein
LADHVTRALLTEPKHRQRVIDIAAAHQVQPTRAFRGAIRANLCFA